MMNSNEITKQTTGNSAYIYGRNGILEALSAGRSIEKIFIAYGAEGTAIEEIRQNARKAGVICSTADRAKFGDLERELRAGKGAAQGVIALCTQGVTLELQELITNAYDENDTPLLLALDGITDPHNLGALARSAECAGFSGIILPSGHSSPVTPVAVKSSAGALEHIPVSKVSELSIALKDCKAAGFTIIGTDLSAKTSYTEQNLGSIPIVLVIGSEGEGMRASIRKLCDQLVMIPMAGKIESLNASVAGGVLMFEILRQRNLLVDRIDN
ncbi:MAG: 23S rRNA (guanosine(2251)-2'-O)-methyltransferase RlmB [Ignavibacteria bacterium]|nr:23S rRNA (guanosine(2251)-2'-O)-methyltransferase RlmB [Ignavibacteria bacterium]